MAGRALYRTWRPSTFEEVVGQEHVTRTLVNALASNRIVHAYLFSGPRGTGKTSTARILAKAVNCLERSDEPKGETQGIPCNECAQCRAIDEGRSMDLIEIDAASNRGIDEIRDLREKVNFAPSQSRAKFYIIDEVHMLTAPAFNALLKTLEEPPAHAYFVLATTEAHRIPATIVSRCQRFDFRPIPLPQIVEQLERIALAEGIEADAAALETMARHATGSMRDAVSLLDQAASYEGERITSDRVQAILGAVPPETVAALARALAERDVPGGLGLVDEAIGNGADARQLTKAVMEYLRGVLLVATAERDPPSATPETAKDMADLANHFGVGRLMRTLRQLGQAHYDLGTTFPPQLPLEMVVVRAAEGERPEADGRAAAGERPASAGRAAAAERSAQAEVPTNQSEVPEEDVEHKAEEAAPEPEAGTEEEPPSAAPEADRSAPDPRGGAKVRKRAAAGDPEALARLEAGWDQMLQDIKVKNIHVEALLKSSEPVSVEDRVVTLGFYYPFHRGKVESPRLRELVEDALSGVLGGTYQLSCVLLPDRARKQATGEKPPRRSAKVPPEEIASIRDDPLIKAALEMGAEVTKTVPSGGSEG